MVESVILYFAKKFLRNVDTADSGSLWALLHYGEREEEKKKQAYLKLSWALTVEEDRQKETEKKKKVIAQRCSLPAMTNTGCYIYKYLLRQKKVPQISAFESFQKLGSSSRYYYLILLIKKWSREVSDGSDAHTGFSGWAITEPRPRAVWNLLLFKTCFKEIYLSIL